MKQEIYEMSDGEYTLIYLDVIRQKRCYFCKKIKPLTKHHLMTKEKAFKLLEKYYKKPREQIKRRVRKRNRMFRRKGGIIMLCVECHNKVHNTHDRPLDTRF